MHQTYVIKENYVTMWWLVYIKEENKIYVGKSLTLHIFCCMLIDCHKLHNVFNCNGSRALTIWMEFSVIPGRFHMGRFIPVECFRKKR